MLLNLQVRNAILSFLAIALVAIFGQIAHYFNPEKVIYVTFVPTVLCVMFLIYHVIFLIRKAIKDELGVNVLFAVVMIFCLYPISSWIFAYMNWKQSQKVVNG